MRDRTEEKRLAILRILRDANGPLGSLKLTERLAALGHEMSERTVRFYLLDMDKVGLTLNLGRSGRAVTEKGLSELDTARSYEKVGFLSAKIDQMTYKMDFDLAGRTGRVVLNVSVIERSQLRRSVPLIQDVFAAGYSMGTLMTLLRPGEQVGETPVPEGSVGIGTVCSITLNGVLVAHGIPINSRFGGLLELRDRKATRFTEFINYDGTTIDPLEVFIRSVMTTTWGRPGPATGSSARVFARYPPIAAIRCSHSAARWSRPAWAGCS